MYRQLRYRTHLLFKVGAGGRVGQWIDTLIMILIALNVVAVIFETVDPIYTVYSREFYLFEVISIAVFSIEYIGRLWVATEHTDYEHPVWGRLRYAATPYMIIDLLAILPFFLAAVIDLRFLRALRFLRFLRVFKLARYSTTLDLFIRVLRRKKEDIVITLTASALLLLVSSGTMYFIERSAQPETFSSIPAAMWWGIITLTTVGYGDMYPVTPLGQVVGGLVAIIGIGFFALPASILAAGFIEETNLGRNTCPHCGECILNDDY